MAKIKVFSKLALVKGIKEATNTGLVEAKDIADEIIPSVLENDIAEFDPKKFGWNEQTLKEIASIANMRQNNIIILSYA